MSTLSERYKEAVRRASKNADQEVSASHVQCNCPGNILLVLFFSLSTPVAAHHRELKEDAKAKESLDDNWLRVVGRAGKSLAQHPSRIYTDAQLGAVQNIGPRLKQIVKDNLWVLYPPDPPSEQELQEEAEQEQAQRRQKQAEKEERRRKRTAEKEQQRRADACGVAGVDALGVPAVGYGGSSAAGAGEAEEAGGPKRKKQKTAKEPKAKKSYCPGLGTANYAFLVELFKAHHNGEEFLSKKQLMDRAGASGLSNKPIYGSQPAHGVAGVQQFTYDGWSNMKTLVNGDPPLVISYSNPKKIKLTPEGIILADSLFRDAVAKGRQAMLPDLGPPPAPLPAAAAGGAGPSNASQPASGSRGSSQVQPTNLARPSGHLPHTYPASTAAAAGRNAYAGTSQATQDAQQVHAAAAALPRPALGSAARSGSGPAASQRPLLHQNGRLSAAGEAAMRRVSSGASAGANLSSQPFASQATGSQPMRSQPRGAQPSSRAHGPACAGGEGVFDLSGDMEAPARTGHGVGSSREAKDAGISDEDLARMLEMGYSIESATKALRGNRTVAEAVEVIEISDSDDDDVGKRPSPAPAAKVTVSGVFLDAADGDDDAFYGGCHGSAPDAGALASQSGEACRGCSSQRQDNDPFGVMASQSNPVLGLSAGGLQGGLLARLESRGSGTARAGLPPRPTASSGAGRTGSGPLSGRAPPVPAAPAASRHASGPPGQASAAASQQNGGGNGDVGTRRLSTGSQQASGSGRLTRDVARHGEAHTSSAYRGIWNLPPFGGQYGMTETDVRLPPLSQGRRFGDEYEVVLILDQREQFSRAGGAGRTESLMQHVQAMTNQGLKLEVRQLEVGDALWVARSLRSPGAEYVLDFIVERKSAGDLEASILDARYEKQKYHLRRCGVRHVLYLLEGDPDQRLRPQHLKTACMTTDIIDGFRVMRTESIGATVRLYKALTDTIKGFYAPLSSSSLEVQRGGQPLVSFAAFKTQTIAVKKTTVRDIWGLMLTAVPGVGPDMAEAVLRKYPTPRSLFEAYRSTMLAARARNLDVTAAANKLLLGTEISKGRAFSINQSTKVFSTLFANAWQL